MKYVDNLEQAANHLRLAVPMMVKYAIPPNPQNYAIWYHYVSGLDPELKKALDNTLQQGGNIDAADSERLYNTYINPESDAEQALQESLQRLIGQVSQSVGDTSDETKQLGSALAVAASKLNQEGISASDGQQLKSVVDDLTHNIEAFSSATAQFQSQLDAAQTEIDELKQALEQSKWAASHDSLTGLHNRAAFQQQIEQRHKRSHATRLILMDIDHFKQINDSFGHNGGDRVLQAVGKILALGESIFTARYGGEEFAILLDKVDSEQAFAFADRLRSSLSQKQLRFNGNATGIASITASFGIAYLDPALSAAETIELADKALYQAKQAGRNCVVSSEIVDFSD